MEKKLINFRLYRFHLLPLKNNEIQTSMFSGDKISTSEIIKNKNLSFSLILNSLDSSKNKTNPIRLHFSEKDDYIFKIAQKKETRITKDFRNQVINNEPYSYVIINNNNQIQKIAISENSEAFSNTNVVKNIFEKIFKKELEQFELNIVIEPLFDSKNFWDYVDKYKEELTYINFQFVRPNLASISSSIPTVFKHFSENTNSHKTHLTIRAPEKGVLENINKSNESINGLVEYSSNGGGNIQLKVKRIKKYLNTSEKPVIHQIDELELEGVAEQVIKLYKTIIE